MVPEAFPRQETLESPVAGEEERRGRRRGGEDGKKGRKLMEMGREEMQWRRRRLRGAEDDRGRRMGEAEDDRRMRMR